jgi:hypothetical protein
MNINSFLLENDNGKPSITMTVFVITVLVCCVKLLLSGMNLGCLSFAIFTGVDFAAAISAAGLIYKLRRDGDAKNQTPITETKEII